MATLTTPVLRESLNIAKNPQHVGIISIFQNTLRKIIKDEHSSTLNRKKQVPCRNGCFQKKWHPQIMNFNKVFHYKPSILGYPYLWRSGSKWFSEPW